METPVTELGLHTVVARAMDDSGNETVESFLFDIRDRPFFSGVGVVEALTINQDSQGIHSIEATILVASHDFASWDINLSTVQLWLLDSNSQWAFDTPLAITRIPDPTPGSSAEILLASYENGYWRLEFEQNFATPLPLDSIIAFDLTGSGLHDGPDQFEFRARFPAVVDPDPVGTLAGQGLTNGDPQQDPPEEDPPQCRWVYEWIPDPDDIFDRPYDGLGVDDWMMELIASGRRGKIHGMGEARDEGVGDATGGAHAVTSGVTLIVRIEPPGCCDDCEIAVVARPSFKVSLAVDPPGKAAAGGTISIATPCGNTEASGGAATGDFDQEFVEFFGYTVPVYETVPPEGLAFAGNLSCVHNSCSIQISIGLTAWMQVIADSNWANWFGKAKARIYRAALNLTVTPTANCQDVAPIDPIRVRYPDIMVPP